MATPKKDPLIALDASLVTGCCDDTAVCLCGWCCPACLFGKTHEKAGLGPCFASCCTFNILSIAAFTIGMMLPYLGPALIMGWYMGKERTALQQRLGHPIEEDNTKFYTIACLTMLCCPNIPCFPYFGMCQEARAVNHEFDKNNRQPLAADLQARLVITPLATVALVPATAKSTAELQAMGLKELREHAAAGGVPQEKIEVARDGDNPKAALISLIQGAPTTQP